MKGFENKQKKRWDAAQARQGLEKKRRRQETSKLLRMKLIRRPPPPEKELTIERFRTYFGDGTGFRAGDRVLISNSNTTQILIILV